MTTGEEEGVENVEKGAVTTMIQQGGVGREGRYSCKNMVRNAGTHNERTRVDCKHRDTAWQNCTVGMRIMLL